MDRNIVIPGQLLSENENEAGSGTYVSNGKVYSLLYGIANLKNRVSVVPFSARYFPVRKDFIIGTVIQITSSNWIMKTGSPYDGLLHVSEFPKRVESSVMKKYMDIGDCAIVRIKDVSRSMKVELTLREQGTKILKNGRLIEITPSRIPRVIGHGGSMVNILKKGSDCDIFVGKNGLIWINGKEKDMDRLTTAIFMIDKQSHTSGLTNRISAFLNGDYEDDGNCGEVADCVDEDVVSCVKGKDSEKQLKNGSENIPIFEDSEDGLEQSDVPEEICKKIDVLLDEGQDQ